MPIQVSYPGVYLEEIPGGQPVVAGVSTASTAFVDFFSRGPMNTAVRVVSMQDVERIFGGLHRRSEASYGLRQYFLNGGQEAWLIRAGDGLAKPAELRVPIRTPGLPARVKASFEDFQAARKAADEAVEAAKAANKALQDLQKEGLSDQEREQGVDDLRSNSRQAAELTKAAAAATRKAAVQARAASDELAIAIAKVKAASGPVADRTAMAAEKAAEAAQASADAAEATSDITGVALRAEPVAEAALRTSAAARTAQAAANEIKAVLDAATAAEAAAAAARVGGPVALKAAGVLHKTDVGGVRLGLVTPEEVAAAYDDMVARVGGDMTGALVQGMAEPGVETIAGVVRDPSFGPLVVFGLGGIATELVGDRTLGVAPLTDRDAGDLVRLLRSWPLFSGYRGAPAVDIAGLEDILLRLSVLGEQVPEVAEMDLNPVIAGPGGVVAVDWRIRIVPAERHPERDLRRLR